MQNPATSPTTSPLEIITQEAVNVALAFGITCGADLALALTVRIVKRLSGQKIYIPSESARAAGLRSRQIRQKFAGNNVSELARQHRITPRQVRNILAQGKD